MCSLGNSVPTTVQAKVPVSLKDLYYLQLCIMCYSPLLSWILWLEWATLSFYPGKINANEHLEDQQFQFVRPWAPSSQVPRFLSLPWVKTHNTRIAGEFWSIAEHVEGQELEPWTPAIPHPLSRPRGHSAVSQRSNFTSCLFCKSDL